MTNSHLPRVVLDTNVVLSACLKADGLEARLVALAVAGEVLVCVTEEVRAEYEDVLRRDKFRSVRERAEGVLQALDSVAIRVTAGRRLTAASDDDDNRFLECAEAAGAAWLVTGNLRHYPGEHAGTKVVNARYMLDSVINSP